MNVEDMQNEGAIELSITLGFIHVNGKAVQHGGRYLEPKDLVEDTLIVIDLKSAEAQSQ